MTVDSGDGDRRRRGLGRGNARGRRRAPLGGLGRPRGWSELGRRRRAAALGARETAARLLWWDWARRRGLRAARGRGGADSGVCVGGEGLQGVVDSELRAHWSSGGAAMVF